MGYGNEHTRYGEGKSAGTALGHVYLVGRYGRQVSIRVCAEALMNVGYGVTSRWLFSKHEAPNSLPEPDRTNLRQKLAHEDIEDLMASDIAVLFTEDEASMHGRGGRHFEAGLFAGWMMTNPWRVVFIVGPKENVFYTHPVFIHHDNFTSFLWCLQDDLDRVRTGSLFEFRTAAALKNLINGLNEVCGYANIAGLDVNVQHDELSIGTVADPHRRKHVFSIEVNKPVRPTNFWTVQ